MMTEAYGTRPLEVFLVEDEALIRMMETDMLEQAGHHVSAEASNIPAALRMALSGSFDIAVLDVNVAGESIDPVVDVLKKRGIPIVFATGYGPAGVPSGSGCPVLRKPFTPDALEEAMKSALADADFPGRSSPPS